MSAFQKYFLYITTHISAFYVVSQDDIPVLKATFPGEITHVIFPAKCLFNTESIVHFAFPG